jgi:hypothetical protein
LLTRKFAAITGIMRRSEATYREWWRQQPYTRQ